MSTRSNIKSSLFVVAEVEVSGTANDVAAIDAPAVDGLTNADASPNVDAASELDTSADVDEQGPARGGAGSSGPRGGVSLA